MQLLFGFPLSETNFSCLASHGFSTIIRTPLLVFVERCMKRGEDTFANYVTLFNSVMTTCKSRVQQKSRSRLTCISH